MENQARARVTLMRAFLLTAFIATATNVFAVFDDSAEQLAIEIMKLVEEGDLATASRKADTLTQKYPDFHLGHKIAADLQSINYGFVPDDFSIDLDGEFSLENLNDELALRWQHALYPPPKNALPSAIIKLSPRQDFVIVSDLAQGRLYVFRNELGEPKLVADHFIGIGRKGYAKEVEGDLRTPLGVYTVTKYIPDEKLPDLYGAGAYPISYPNPWDKLKKRTGYGIWIHGVPEAVYNRPPLSSEGCITMNNIAFKSLAPYMDLGNTTVINTNTLSWLSPKEWNQRQINVLAKLDQWQSDWESQDHEAYLRHYDTSFQNESKSFVEWDKHKRWVNKNKDYIRVDLSNISIFEYAGEEDTIQANFKQKYESSNLNGSSEKTLYLKSFENDWRIIYEGKSNL